MVSYNRPLDEPRRLRDRSVLQRRVSAGPVARAQRLRRQLLRRRRQRSPRRDRSRSTRSSSPPGTTRTGRARSGRTSKRRATPACNLAFMSGNGFLEDRAISRASTARTRRTARWSATRRRSPTARSTPRRTSGPARGATRASSTRKGRKPENALTGTIATVGGFGTTGWWCRPVREAALLAQHRRRAVEGRRDRGAGQGRPRPRMGRGSRQRRPAGGPHRLSETTVDNVPYVQDCGSTYDSGTATHR